MWIWNVQFWSLLVLLVVGAVDWTHSQAMMCAPINWRRWVRILLDTGVRWAATWTMYYLYVTAFDKGPAWWGGHRETVAAVFIVLGVLLAAGWFGNVIGAMRSWWRLQEALRHPERLIVLHDGNGVRVLFDPKYQVTMTELNGGIMETLKRETGSETPWTKGQPISMASQEEGRSL
ncbi:MAG: hypothetical protein ABF966_09080 [Bifidobacterium psychraerophilum]|uniref:hypothetical protein n=1 Tax=Bifidobacterium psychraerophilum TaxID=218140 RepID=UPI0039E81564